MNFNLINFFETIRLAEANPNQSTEKVTGSDDQGPMSLLCQICCNHLDSCRAVIFDNPDDHEHNTGRNIFIYRCKEPTCPHFISSFSHLNVYEMPTGSDERNEDPENLILDPIEESKNDESSSSEDDLVPGEVGDQGPQSTITKDEHEDDYEADVED